MRRPGWDVCNGYSIYTAASFGAVASQMSPGLYNTDFRVDMMVISGQAALQGSDGAIPLGSDTTYDGNKADLERIAQQNYDFDGDGISDTSKLGRWVEKNDESSATGETITVFEETSADEAELQGVWLSSNGDIDPKQPDLTRLMDWSADFEDRALLSQISTDDLQNTDIYVFRESNGQLVAERRGLTDNEYLNGVNDSEGKFFFTLHMVGRYGDLYRRGEKEFEQWQAKGRVNPALHKRASDHLRPGERVRIVAINRATGYTGSTITTMEAAGASGHGQQLSFHISDITMTPPNLKIWAERNSTVDYGMTKGERREQTIGNEGAGLGTDDTITIYSEWLDQNGRPLPDELGDYGYTGRIALVVAPNTLGAGSLGSQVSQFPIKPGRQLQVIRLPEKVLAAQHVYIQVSGEPNNRHPDFSSTGLQEGILKYRPDNFVPFKVPVYDENSSLLQQQAYKKAKQEQPGATLTHPKPVYQWAYRPELQFSIYDLLVDEARREDADNNSQDILDSKTPLLSSADAFLKILYDLQTNSNNPLEAYSYNDEKELVFALGEQELKATVTKGAGDHQKLEFDDLSVLANLEAEDYLSLRLYTNNDAGNILWEWAFEYFAVDSSLTELAIDPDNGDILLSADNPVLPMYAVLAGYANRKKADKLPLTVFWQVKGEGVMMPGVQRDHDLGMFASTLTMPVKAGAETQLIVRLGGEYNTDVDYGRIRVIPGRPHSMTLEVEGEPHSLGIDELKATVILKDQHGNPVADGTSVTVNVEGDAVLEYDQLSTEQGKITFAVRGGQFASQQNRLRVQLGELQQEVLFNVKPLNVSFVNVADRVSSNNKSVVQVRVTDSEGNPVDNVEVDVSSTYGLLVHNTLTTNADGLATTQLISPRYQGQGELTARVGYASMVKQPYEVVQSSRSTLQLNTARTLVIGDQSHGGKISYQRYDSTPITTAYNTISQLQVLGQEGATIPVSIGDMADPNLAPLAAFYMNELPEDEEGNLYVPDETGRYTGVLNSVPVGVSGAHPMGKGRSYFFRSQVQVDNDPVQFENSQVTIADAEALKLDDGFGFRLDLRPEKTAGQILSLSEDSLSLSLDEQRRVILRIAGESETGQLVSEPLARQRWYTVAVRYQDGQWQLQVNDQQYLKAGAAPVWKDSDELILGGGFEGYMNSLRFYDWRSAPLVTFADGSTEEAVTVGQNGKALVTIHSQGNMPSDMTIARVAVTSPQDRSYINLTSTTAYTDLAPVVMDFFYPGRPPINVTGLYESENPYQLSLTPLLDMIIPKAFAADGWSYFIDVVNFIIPFEDFATLGQQLYYLTTNDPEFDELELALSSIGVFSIIPIVKPIKAVTTPLQKMVRTMKKVNPKFVKAFAGVLGKLVKQASKGKYDGFIDLLPFMVITAQMISDEESRQALEIIVKSIGSDDDLWAWIDYLRLPADGWEGKEIPEIELSSTPITASNENHISALWIARQMLNTVVGQAYAAKGKKGKLLSKEQLTDNILSAYRKLKPLLDEDPTALSRGVRSVTKGAKNTGEASLRKAAKSGAAVAATTYMSKRAGTKVAQALWKGNTRIPPLALMAIVVYLENQMGEECESGCIVESEIKRRVRAKYPWAFTSLIQDGYVTHSGQIGEQFHLALIALKQLRFETGVGGEILSVEQKNLVKLFEKKTGTLGPTMERRVDIVVENLNDPSHPIWVEGKSLTARHYKSKRWENSKSFLQSASAWSYPPKSKSTRYHKQFYLDRLAKTDNILIPSTDDRKENHKSSGIEWWLQEFRLKTKAGPTGNQVEEFQKKLAKLPKGNKATMLNSLGYTSKAKHDLHNDARNIKSLNFTNWIVSEGRHLLEGIESQLVEELIVNRVGVE